MKTMIRAGAAVLLLAVGLPLAADQHEQAGILVTAVDPDGPAAAAGIERGDLILSIDGQPVEAGRDLTEALADAEEPQVSLTVKHGDEVRDLSVAIARVWGHPRLGLVVLGARHDGFDRPGRMGRMGRMDRMMPKEWMSKKEWMFRFGDKMDGMSGAKVMEVVEDGPAAAAGLQEGDWITAVDGEALGESDGHLADLIRSYEPGDSISLEYERDGEAMTATVNLGEHPETGGALLGVRYQPVPWFDADDMDKLRGMFDGLKKRFDRRHRAEPAPDFEAPESNQAM